MAAYEALYTGTNGTDLSAYTSDSGHTHSKVNGAGSFQIQGNELTAIGAGNGAYYIASYVPPSADYKIRAEFNIQSTLAFNVSIGIRCDTGDNDGIWVTANGFDDLFHLFKRVNGTAAGDFDTVAMTTGLHTIEIEVVGDNVQWWLDTVSQGTFSLGGEVTAAGRVGFDKFGEASTSGEQNRLVEVEVTESGPGDPYLGAGAAATAASGNVTPAFPGSLATNDILLCDITALDNVDCSLPSGNGWLRKMSHNNGSELRKELWWKRRAGGDSDTNVVVTHTAGGKIIARVHAFRFPDGPTTGDPFEAVGGPTSVSAAASGTFPNVTTVNDDAYLFYGFGYGEDFTTGPAISNAQGLTLTERDETEVA